ncbi:transcriptional regulator, TetR family [Planococcus sp. PAMC 21323]|uniref:TetR/AcrR family transcriptional regulator n=1 Tax=Planococcus sp. PAMC 21323 TaxID=1526927 RepID=UPI00056E1B87|nr:TetR/AcrR family transcriptional regulator [Planococcus sp. PAMC 21323]AIY05434.1 transcriptional regulator, TetR family [Planococcus sp. PAMC 21323]
MDNKELKKRRMWTYFIDATEELINTEGFQQVTIRKVAEKAGYNSATIYNYFGELSHLLFFASLKFLKPYIEEVTEEMKLKTDPIEKYLVAWEVFSKYSFNSPEVFHSAFLMDLGEHPESLLTHYYELYPVDLLDVSEELKPALMERSIDERGRFAISYMINAGLLTEGEAEELNEITNLIWQGMFTKVLNNRNRYTSEEAHERTMKYIREVITFKVTD